MTNDHIAKKLEGIQKEFQQLGSQISELATERLEEYRDEAMREVKHVAKDVSREAEKQVRRADEYTHKNPWVVVAGASAVALLVGMLFSRKK